MTWYQDPQIVDTVKKAVNRASKNVTVTSYKSTEPTLNRLILTKTLTPVEKHTKLLEATAKSIISTFALPPEKLSSKSIQAKAKKRFDSQRAALQRLQGIVHYLINTQAVQPAKNKSIPLKKQLSKSLLVKSDLEKLEQTAYNLIENILTLDKKALKEYKKKEHILEKQQQKLNKNAYHHLRVQLELLEHLESKIPPPSKVKTSYFTSRVFTHWSSTTLAIVCALLSNGQHIDQTLSKVKKNAATRKELHKKISYLQNEYAKLLKIEQSKYLSLRGKRSLSFEKLLEQTFVIQDL